MTKLATREELDALLPDSDLLERTLKWKSYLGEVRSKSDEKRPSIKELNLLLEKIGFAPKQIKQARNFVDKLKLVSDWYGYASLHGGSAGSGDVGGGPPSEEKKRPDRGEVE